VEEEAGNPVERMANMLPRIVAADYQPLPQSVRTWPHLTSAFQGLGHSNGIQLSAEFLLVLARRCLHACDPTA
jgi:hypothetical protein